MYNIEIDSESGFCFGVTTAIKKAEEELAKGTPEYAKLKNVKVLLRAHGEPPETYRIAAENNIEIIDATCPVVLRLLPVLWYLGFKKELSRNISVKNRKEKSR